MIFLVSLLALPFLHRDDPAPGVLHDKAEARNLECEWLSAEAASALRPGEIRTSSPRGDYVERAEMICIERLLGPGVRDPRDEAILRSLDTMAAEMANAATSRRPDLAARTWLVESYYPSANVSVKLSFAGKNALVRLGLQVSDRTPMLAVGDADILNHLAPEDAYPLACRRYAETGSLDEGDALLAIVSRDLRETALHAGLCADGRWTWLL